MFDQMHETYFRPLVGDLRVRDMGETNLMAAVFAAAVKAGFSERQARAAWGTYKDIKEHGEANVASLIPRSTLFSHKAILKAAGIGAAQLATNTVVPLVRYRVIEMGAPVKSWGELYGRRAA